MTKTAKPTLVDAFFIPNGFDRTRFSLMRKQAKTHGEKLFYCCAVEFGNPRKYRRMNNEITRVEIYLNGVFLGMVDRDSVFTMADMSNEANSLKIAGRIADMKKEKIRAKSPSNFNVKKTDLPVSWWATDKQKADAKAALEEYEAKHGEFED